MIEVGEAAMPTWVVVLTSGAAGALVGALVKGVTDWLTETRRFKREDRLRSEATRRAAYAALMHAAAIAAEELRRLGTAIDRDDDADADQHYQERQRFEREAFRLYSEISFLAPANVTEAARVLGEALSPDRCDPSNAYAALDTFNAVARQDLGLPALPGAGERQ
jgi:hypothetical protein